jgi:uncharacterized protein (UPF0276 family)
VYAVIGSVVLVTALPPHGSGIGLRPPHYEALSTTDRQIDWLEFIPENYVARGGGHPRRLRECAERWQVVPHGVSLSLGGPDPFDRDYILGLKRLLDEIDAPYYSDHLCYARLGGVNLHDLLPLPFSEAAVRHAAARIKELADRLERPVVVENISYYAVMPGSEMDEPSFVAAVVEEADCGLLLDVNNIHVNARNHGEDAMAQMRRFPLERIAHVHLAGYELEPDGRALDSHCGPAEDEVWAMYEALIAERGPVPTLFEWDTRLPELERVLDEADRARSVLEAAK